MYKGSVYMIITIIVRVISIWDKVLCKLRVYFDGLVRKNKVFYEYIQCIDTNIDVVVEFIDV